MKNKVLSAYDYFLMLGVIVCSVIYSIMSVRSGAETLSGALIGSVAGVSGLFCVVLVAKGSIWNYLFGVVNVSLYAWISYKSSIYGDACLNALYYLPMQFIGYFQWQKRLKKSDSSTKQQGESLSARRLSWKNRLFVGLLCVVLILGLGFILRHYGDPQPFKDSATTVLSIVAQMLMALAFMEQWVLWIITNVLSVVMWAMLFYNGEPHSGLMVIMWVFYLMNSVNGLRVWLKLSRN